MKISVLTSVTGAKDALIAPYTPSTAEFIAYTDNSAVNNHWTLREAYNRFKDPRRNSRIHKMLSHLYCDTEYSIWADGNIELLQPPEYFIENFLKDHDIAMFIHQTRDCIYDEAMTCAKSGLDDPEVIIKQVKKYEQEGFGKHKGLYVGNFIIRRHTPKVIAFNNAWWAEYCAHSVRDQISLPYCLDKVGLRINAVESPWNIAQDGSHAFRGNFIKIYPHLILNPPIR